jgi:hypothetical protein
MSVQFLMKSENTDDNLCDFEAVIVEINEPLMQLIEKRAQMLRDLYLQDQNVFGLSFQNAHEAKWQSVNLDDLQDDADDNSPASRFNNQDAVPLSEFQQLPKMSEADTDSPKMKFWLWYGRNAQGLSQTNVNVYWSAYASDAPGTVDTPGVQIPHLRSLFDEHSQCPY